MTLFREYSKIDDLHRDIIYAIISAKVHVCIGYACVQPTYNSLGYVENVKVAHNKKWILIIENCSVQVLVYESCKFMDESKFLYNAILKSINSNLKIDITYELVNGENEKVNKDEKHKLEHPMLWNIFQMYEPNTLVDTLNNGISFNKIGYATVQKFLKPNGFVVRIKISIKGHWILSISKRGVKILSYTDEYMKEVRRLLNKVLKFIKSNLYVTKSNIICKR
jgi:hypothetical protein